MNPFILEAFIIGAKEGAILICGALLVYYFIKGRQRGDLMKPLAAGLVVGMVAAVAAAIVQTPFSTEVRDLVVKMVGYVFGLFYLFSVAALFTVESRDIPRPLKTVFSKGAVVISFVFISGFMYSIPDLAGTSFYIKDLFIISGKNGAIPASSLAGFSAGAGLSLLVLKRLRAGIAALFDLPQILLFLALIKLLGGGVHGFAELSLIPSVQAGLMKLIHDVVHQTLILILIPDHPLLTMTARKYVGLLFGDGLAMWLSLVIITVPLILFIKRHFAENVAVPEELHKASARRRFIKSVRDDRVLKSIPIFLFMLVIMITWFAERGESLQRLYNPAPTPLAATGTTVVIPLRTPVENVLDGAIHKFSVTIDGEVIRLLLVKKQNGTLVVCLDACAVCPPEGYAQEKERVICLFCRTPIPVNTVGNPGGCNPIPLSALVTAEDVRVPVGELREKWTMIKSGEPKGARVR